MSFKRTIQQEASSISGNNITPSKQKTAAIQNYINPNPDSISGWSFKQAKSLQTIIIVNVNQAVTAIIKISINNAVNQTIIVFEIRNISLDH